MTSELYAVHKMKPRVFIWGGIEHLVVFGSLLSATLIIYL